MRLAGSSAVIAGLLAALAVSLFPTVLHSTVNPARSLTLYAASSGAYSQRVALYWWPAGLLLAAGYLTLTFFAHRRPGS